MGELKPYPAVINGMETQLMLDEEGARLRGLVIAEPVAEPEPGAEKAAAPAANKARTAPNKKG